MSEPGGRPRRGLSRQRKLGFALVLITAVLLGGEGVLRLLGFPRGIVRSFSHLWDPGTPGIVGLFRPGSHRVSYPRELAYQVEINALGLRGPALAREKPPGTRRILALGDSVTFGYYVDDAHAYPRLLETHLRSAGHAVEVLNGGCGHFSIADELRFLDERLLDLAPDVVVLQFCSNDLAPGELDRSPLLYEDIRSGRAAKGSWLRSTALGEAQLLAAIRLKQWRRERAGKWPPKGFAGVGPEASDEAWTRYAAELRRLKQLLDERGVPLLLLSFAGLGEVEQEAPPGCDARLAALAGELGIPFRGVWSRYRTVEEPQRLYHWPLDPHPSRLGNQLLAEVAAEMLAEAGQLAGP